MEMDFKHLHVEFFMDAKLNKRKTAEEGRPIYQDVEKVRIRTAGDPKQVLVAPAHDASSVRHPETNQRLTYAELHEGPYAAFKKGQQFIGSGTPLAEAPFLTAAKRAELNALNIFTVDSLAELDGSNLSRLGMGGRDLKNQAKAWLDKAADSSGITQMSAELDRLRAEVAALTQAGDMVESAEKYTPRTGAPSPFDDWDDDTIRLWIEEQGGEKPHHACKHDKLVSLADELNAKIAKQNEAA